MVLVVSQCSQQARGLAVLPGTATGVKSPFHSPSPSLSLCFLLSPSLYLSLLLSILLPLFRSRSQHAL